MATGELDNFSLPRDDWYDDNGRIYKDVLIENLNAIEAKLNELNSLTGFEISLPATSEIVYPNTTLASDDNEIVNLKSFLDITGLINYPLELKSTNSTIEKISYWSSGYSYITRYNVSTSASSSVPYVVMDSSGNISAVASINQSTPPVIGFFENGRIVGINDKDNIPINALYYLPNMKSDTYNFTFSSGTRDEYDSRTGIGRGGRLIGAGDTNTKTSGTNNVTFRDLGRTSK